MIIKMSNEDFNKLSNEYYNLYCSGGGTDIEDSLYLIKEILGVEFIIKD